MIVVGLVLLEYGPAGSEVNGGEIPDPDGTKTGREVVGLELTRGVPTKVVFGNGPGTEEVTGFCPPDGTKIPDGIKLGLLVAVTPEFSETDVDEAGLVVLLKIPDEVAFKGVDTYPVGIKLGLLVAEIELEELTNVAFRRPADPEGIKLELEPVTPEF